MTRVEERLSELLHAAAPPSPGVAFDDVARRVRRRRTARWSVFASAVTVAAIVAGVTVGVGFAGPDSRPPATKRAPTSQSASDLVALARHVHCPQSPSAMARDRLAAFNAVAVVTCRQEVRELPGQGQWAVEVRSVATGGVTALLAALERPNELRTHGLCTMEAPYVPLLILVDDKGRELAPTPPVDECQKPQQQFMNAYRAVTWREVSVRKVRQVLTPQAQTAGCDQQFKNMTYLDGRLGARTSSGGPLFPRTTRTVRLCIYRVTGDDLLEGTFERGFALSASDTAKLLTALAGPGRAGNCPPQRSFAAISTNGIWATVELGGCWRVSRSYPNFDIGSADASVVTALLRAH